MKSLTNQRDDKGEEEDSTEQFKQGEKRLINEMKRPKKKLNETSSRAQSNE